MPRLLNDGVFKTTLAKGLGSTDYFGLAAGKEGEKYLGFVFGRDTMVTLDSDTLLVQRDAADAYREATKPAAPEPVDTRGGEPPFGGSAGPVDAGTEQESLPEPAGAPLKTRFYGTVDIDPVKAKMDFAQIYDEVVEQLTSRLGVDVRISIEIQANCPAGFDEALQRTIKENCSVLKFAPPDFE